MMGNASNLCVGFLWLYLRIATLILLTLTSCFAVAQSINEDQPADNSIQLDELQKSLDRKLAERAKLRQLLTSPGKVDVLDTEARITALNEEIGQARLSFESLAIGSIEMDVFSEQSFAFDWKNEMTQILMPVVENLKTLTEKPRKIELLKTRINQRQAQLSAIEQALTSINFNLMSTPSDETKASMITVLQDWQERKSDTARDLELITTQLYRLQHSSEPWWKTVWNSIIVFIKGRGLTLVMAGIAAVGVWYLARYVVKLIEKRRRSGDRKNHRTRQRLARYTFRILTVFLILLAVIMVFYLRGDLLLMALSFLLMVAIILGLRNTVPRFIAETRLLLDIGSVREDERVMYNGIPWQVVSLNIFSVLRNPELTGVVRLPLESMHGMVSRPAGEESWFPASKGDYILLSDEKLMHVVSLTPERVELENLAGTITTISTAEFYGWTFDNLSRGESYAVVGEFGIDYRHQNESVDEIPKILAQSVRDELARSDISNQIENVSVELKSAGASSLDLWVCVTVKSAAAGAYLRLSRMIQQTCVRTCTKQQWEIPFPQLTLHQAN